MTSEQIKALTGQYILNTYGRFPVAIDHGEGARLYSPEGKEYIDFTSGIGVTALGYGDQDWVDAITAQANRPPPAEYSRVIICPENTAPKKTRADRISRASPGPSTNTAYTVTMLASPSLTP